MPCNIGNSKTSNGYTCYREKQPAFFLQLQSYKGNAPQHQLFYDTKGHLPGRMKLTTGGKTYEFSIDSNKSDYSCGSNGYLLGYLNNQSISPVSIDFYPTSEGLEYVNATNLSDCSTVTYRMRTGENKWEERSVTLVIEYIPDRLRRPDEGYPGCSF